MFVNFFNFPLNTNYTTANQNKKGGQKCPPNKKNKSFKLTPEHTRSFAVPSSRPSLLFSLSWFFYLSFPCVFGV